MRNAPPHARSLGRYQLLFMLGQGGMGEVHLAKLTGAAGFEKLCIVKTILPQMQADQQFVERFHHEARVLVHLNHSNIAQVYDMGDFDGTLYMAIEYVPGVDLSRVESRVRRQQSAMPVPVALYLAQQVTEALGYAHRKTGPDGSPLGIVHRDVSPQNVMVSYEGEVKVIDFGLAKSAARSQHTLPQTVMGKLGYMSPEQAMAKPVDYRSDIFSAGILVWEMLAGRPLYGGGTMGEMLAQMAFPTVPPLRSVRPEISPTLEQIVMRALQTDPAARYSRADDFARALNELAVRESLTVGAEDVGNYVRAMCPEEFAAERQLQSKLSLLRKKGTPETEEVPIDAPGTEGTFLKPSTPAVPSQELTPAQRALSVVQARARPAPAPEPQSEPEPPSPNPGRGRTVVRQQAAEVAPPPPARGRTVVQSKARPAPGSAAESPSEPLIVPRSKAPWALGGVTVLALLGGAGWLLFNPTQGSAPRAVDPVAVKQPLAEVPKAQEPEVVADAGQREPAPPKRPEETPKTLGLVDVVGQPKEISVEGDRALLVVRRGEKESFREGEPVLIVGQPLENGKQVPLYARATITLATPTLVKAAPTEGQLTQAARLFFMKDQASRGGVTRREPLKKNDPAAVREPEAPPAKPEPVVKVEPEEKSEPAKKDPPPAMPAPEKVVSKSTPAGLSGAIGVSPATSVGGQVIRIQNQSGRLLTQCAVRLTSNRTANLAELGLGEVRMKYSDFRPDPRPPDPQGSKGWSSVVCREGSGYFWTTWLAR